MKVNATIPVLNRRDSIGQAVESALKQTYGNKSVTVIDDGSDDGTWEVLKRFEEHPNFHALRLGENVGTAQAKNVSILLSKYDAITFHDSDDIALPNKLLLQARALKTKGHRADKILNWEGFDYRPGENLAVDIAVGAYNLIKMDGSVHKINKRISLLDDFFPNLQFPSKTEGDWCLVNAGLFRKKVFTELGGYLDSVEEDREIRNRAVAYGAIFFFIEEPLLDKIEMSDSLTIKEDTNYVASRRLRDRNLVWERNELYRKGLWGKRVAEVNKVEMDLSEVRIVDVINPEGFTLNRDIPATEATYQKFSFFGEKDMPAFNEEILCQRV